MPDPVTRIMGLIAATAIALGDGDETLAASLLRSNGPVLGRSETWYWWDRAAVALVHVLLPDTRAGWADEPLGPAHLPALMLAEALEAARGGDLYPARTMIWPDSGVVRAHLPARWVIELAAAGLAAGNPPPDDLLDAVGPRLHAISRGLASSTSAAVAASVTNLVARRAVPPPYRLTINVLGTLEMSRDEVTFVCPELRRTRVRELISYLIARKTARREAVAADLWPQSRDGAHNLRVTLNYLQRVLQPERTTREPPYFLRSDGPWLKLADDDRLRVDVWVLDQLLDEADAAERSNEPGAALAALRSALPIWRGEPYADVPYADWVQLERARLRARYTAAALRTGELLLAGGAPTDARDAARYAVHADPTCEPAYRILIGAAVALGDDPSARHALQQCRSALAAINAEPSRATTGLIADPH
jgi:DNA-binding SARP family transcriptional activator